VSKELRGRLAAGGLGFSLGVVPAAILATAGLDTWLAVLGILVASLTSVVLLIVTVDVLMAITEGRPEDD